MLLVALLFASFSAPVFSQESETAQEADSDWYYGKLIKSVTFKGLKNVASKDVDGVTSGFIGKQFNDEVFADMIDRIYALDIFEDIVPEAVPGDARGNTVAITFNVKERPAVSRVVISGNKQLRTAEIKDKLSVKEKDVFVESKISSEEREIMNLYIEKGFTNVKVSSNTKETEKGIEIVYMVDEGRATVISKIAFRGNKVFNDRQIKKNIKLKEAK